MLTNIPAYTPTNEDLAAAHAAHLQLEAKLVTDLLGDNLMSEDERDDSDEGFGWYSDDAYGSTSEY